MEQEKIDKIQVIVLCLVIAFFLMMSMKVNAQERLHEVDTVKYKYFDLQSRPVRPGFFQETNMGFSAWFYRSRIVTTNWFWSACSGNRW